ncbi:hypothetical protein [Parasphingorhabdus sp.]|uniref:hypothetical protein n=1 Tax=Parasphingorhabdus sp. TaxID=2709688 RepID=UPI003A92DD9A
MKIRSIIIMLTVPLFLVMASVNGALLYFQQKAEMSRALGEQALAAAVVTAEFVAAMEDPQQELARPLRRQAMDAASRRIVGMQAIYLVDADGAAIPLTTDSVEWLPQPDAPVVRERIAPTMTGTDGSRFVAAFAPAANGRFIAVRLDAEPMFAQIEEIKRAILLIVLGASIFAAGLSWFVARRIERELRINGRSLAAIAAGKTVSGEDGLRIRETRDLADAVRLMGASQSAAEMRDRRVVARNDRKRNLGEAVLRSRALLFKPLEQEAAGARIAMRISRDAPSGAFFALAAVDEAAAAVIGCCAAEDPVSALAQATAARRFIEANWIDMGAENCLAVAREAYRIEELVSVAWRSDELPQPDERLLCIADADVAAAAQRYISANSDATPAEWLAAIEILLAPSGIFMAVGASGSADRSQRA